MLTAAKERALTTNIGRVKTKVAAAAQRSGRQPGEITIVAVSKTVPPEMVAAAARLGIDVFGENRVQEAKAKIPAVAILSQGSDIRWHMIGHLQSNKAETAVGLFQMVQSVDTLRLAARINLAAGRLDRRLPILMEVNVSSEPSKHGFALEELPEALAAIEQMEHLVPEGLMTVAPLVPDPELARPVFRRLREARDSLRERFPATPLFHLSIGMSNDYPVAIEEGATIVRVGRAIFGERADAPP